MLEQELASISQFILSKVKIQPYFKDVMQGCKIPCVFFPTPEVIPATHTLDAYTLSYVWIIKFFAKDTQTAYTLAKIAGEAIVSDRYLIPLADIDGALRSEKLRLQNVQISKADSGVYQLSIYWNCYRNFEDIHVAVEKMMEYEASYHIKQDTLGGH